MSRVDGPRRKGPTGRLARATRSTPRPATATHRTSVGSSEPPRARQQVTSPSAPIAGLQDRARTATYGTRPRPLAPVCRRGRRSREVVRVPLSRVGEDPVRLDDELQCCSIAAVRARRVGMECACKASIRRRDFRGRGVRSDRQSFVEVRWRRALVIGHGTTSAARQGVASTDGRLGLAPSDGAGESQTVDGSAPLTWRRRWLPCGTRSRRRSGVALRWPRRGW